MHYTDHTHTLVAACGQANQPRGTQRHSLRAFMKQFFRDHVLAIQSGLAGGMGPHVRRLPPGCRQQPAHFGHAGGVWGV